MQDNGFLLPDTHLLFTVFLVHAYGKIRTVQFAPPAPGAPLRINHGRSAIIIELYTFPRTERGADTAGFAPIPKDIYLEALVSWFRAFSCGIFFSFGLAFAPAPAPPVLLALLLIAFHMPSNYKCL
jgi:hypothetical protein